MAIDSFYDYQALSVCLVFTFNRIMTHDVGISQDAGQVIQ